MRRRGGREGKKKGRNHFRDVAIVIVQRPLQDAEVECLNRAEIDEKINGRLSVVALKPPVRGNHLTSLC